MTETIKPIGILGGTFDPVHNGHLRVALDVLEELALAEIRLIPCHQPPHRGQPSASSAQRLAMLQWAVAGQSGFVLDDRELRRPGPSYMLDTLLSLRAEFAESPLCLLVGSDAFRELHLWHRWRELFELAHLVVLQRPGSSDELPLELAQEVKRRRLLDTVALTSRSSGGVFFFTVTQLDISATRIRELLAVARSPRYLLPDSVLTFINQQGLYR